MPRVPGVPVVAAETTIVRVASLTLPAVSADSSFTWKVPAWVNVCVAVTPDPSAVLSPNFHVHWLLRPLPASVPAAVRETSCPTFAVVGAPAVSAGAVRSRITHPQPGAEMFASLASTG